ncbi:MAG TPA: GDP-mannose 4,6-dehydratase [Dehalococcoidia bacterium]|nr:GDP-mannose 4,6-dehydratase [Dehalococcoidia bacterium]
MSRRRALITGITGQDGSYLTELLLSRGYEVHGIVRRSSVVSRSRIDELRLGLGGEKQSRLHLHYGDLSDQASLCKLIERARPDEVYNLAAQSHVRISFDVPEFTFDVTGLGAFRLLECVRRTAPEARFYQAGSSEMFGHGAPAPQNEQTPFHPRSPYAIAKVFAHHTAVHYREAYGMFVVNGILFNHESPRRGENFVTRKIAMAAARIAAGLEREVVLGNLEAKRDWGYAPEYVQAMWLMLQQPEPDDFVIATGEAHSVREFLDLAFKLVGLDYQRYMRHEAGFERPTEVDYLCGDASKAKRVLGWEPKVRFAQLVQLMVDHEVTRIKSPAAALNRVP